MYQGSGALNRDFRLFRNDLLKLQTFIKNPNAAEKNRKYWKIVALWKNNKATINK